MGALSAPAAADHEPGHEEVSFTLLKSDLEFILKQIKIAEAHAAGGQLLGAGENQVPNTLIGHGLRTVTGEHNNLVSGQSLYGASDTLFPRLLKPPVFRAAETPPPQAPPGPGGPGAATSYEQTSGLTYDSGPRVASNLIVSQSVDNPAAVAAATRLGVDPAGFDHDGKASTPNVLDIPNQSPDLGLSAPFNAWFTFFGQFFDHGLDLVTKGGSGTVVVPLNPDDPQYVEGSRTNFMVLTRATNQPGADGVLGTADDVREHTNTTTPFVDQNQTYTSHPAHQVFLREYDLDGAGNPVPSGHLLDGKSGGLPTWTEIKQQAQEKLGVSLSDTDVLNVPLVMTDPYGAFRPGGNGRPQLVLNGSARVGTNHAFLDDIAHHAVPVGDHDANPATPPAPLAPDADTVPGPNDRNGTTYDDELLGEHFITGDGRGNENVGLTAVHHVFHSEHNRVVEQVKGVIEAEAAADPEFRAEWAGAASGWNGERLFQAGRLVTEMQYQHLVFEEFGRKISPNIDVIPANESGYMSTVNPAIAAEFASVVYRFGHSMLTETVDRVGPAGEDLSLTLLDAFLNPLAYTNGGQLTSRQAAGAVVRGTTGQHGNEIDEFVTDVLRNNLVGLPLDLATINMARGRDVGIPGLNEARRQFFAASGDSTVRPYASWTDFGTALRNKESLVNFVAAYGTHASIPQGSGATVDARRAAAALLVNGGEGAPGDRVDFMNGTGAYATPSGGTPVTGLEGVDYWAGGLAEKPRIFGSMLGSSFNWVFEKQMEDLQNADRFYYLSRLIGTNLLGQLEANSFSALIMRNTDVADMPFDSFGLPGCTVHVAEVGDPPQQVCEGGTLSRTPDGTLRYVGEEHLFMVGTDGADMLRTDEGDDTILGKGGADVMEGGDGNDGLLGGPGDDRITDLNGDDVIKGGNGHDAINAGPGLDLILSGSGKDFVMHGSDETESFAGIGDDVVLGGNAHDIIAGNEGHDWLEGAGGTDLLQGDNRNGFQDDPNGGDDVLVAAGGNDDYDAEGGDDIMVAGPGTNRNEGMLGFDWVTNTRNPQPAVDDMNVSRLLAPDKVMADRFDLVEGLSGWRFNDVLRGDDRSADTDGELTLLGHELRDTSRITGLADVLGGVTSFTGGNVILAGEGSDLIEGRGGDDVINGDAWLQVELAAGGQRYSSASQLQAAVFDGDLSPADITIVREVVVPAASDADIDVAEYPDLRAAYDVVDLGGGVWRVTHARVGPGVPDQGSDLLRNVEAIDFGDQRMLLAELAGNTQATGEVALSSTAPVENATLTASQAFTDADGVNTATIVYSWQMEALTATWVTVATGTTFVPDDPQVGKRLRVVANFVDNKGFPESVLSPVTAPVINVNDAPVGAPLLSTNSPAVGTAVVAQTDHIVDADGIPTNPDAARWAYQWQQNNTNGNGPFSDITGATAQTFTPTAAQVGRRLRVVVSYTDSHGARETLTSPQSVNRVVAAPVAPTTEIPVVTMAATLDFNRVRLGTTSTQRLRVTNTGNAPLVISGVSTTGTGFSATLGTCTTAVAPGGRCELSVSFRPTSTAAGQGTLTVRSNAPTAPTTTLTGSGR